MAPTGMTAFAVTLVINVYKYFLWEARHGLKYARSKFMKRTIAATGLSRSLINKILQKDGKKDQVVKKKER